MHFKYCQALFTWQIVTEERKTNEARNMSYFMGKYVLSFCPLDRQQTQDGSEMDYSLAPLRLQIFWSILT